MPDLRRPYQPYSSGLKLTIDLEFLRPSTIIELANDLLSASKDKDFLSEKDQKNLVELHVQLITYLSVAHSDEFLDFVDS